MKGKKLNYNFLECARKMPPLRHSKSEPFDITQSDVAKWLAAQPDMMQKLFDMAASHKVISYDPTTKMWKGVNRTTQKER